MSLELQSSAIDSLVKKIGKSGSADERMLAISIALPSIRIQLIDPNIYVLARDSAQKRLGVGVNPARGDCKRKRHVVQRLWSGY